jgi:hypothetical protein
MYRPAAARAMPETPPRPPRATVAGWGLQVGAFASASAAQQAAAAARRMSGAGDVHVEQISVRGRPAWRAQITGMSESEMRGAMNVLARRHISTQPLRPDNDRMASR